MAQAKAKDDDDDDADNGQKQLSLQMSNALRTVNDLWQRSTTEWSVNRANFVNSKLDVSQLKRGSSKEKRDQSRKEPESEQCAV